MTRGVKGTKPNKRYCIVCGVGVIHKYVKGKCMKCYVNDIQDSLPRQRCQCGNPNCHEIIPTRSLNNRPMRFADGHHFYGKKHTKEARAKIKAGYKPQKTCSSKAEIMIHSELDKLDIMYFTQRGIRLDEFIHPVDIFIPPNYCIEIDGNHWHTLLVKRRHIPVHQNFKIDYQLEKRGYIVRRYWESDVKENLGWVINQISRTIGKNYRINEYVFCACGCGGQRRKYDKQGRERIFINNHHQRVKK